MIGQPTKCAVRSFSVNGVQMSGSVINVKLFESICKPYLTASAIIIDDRDYINTLDIKGGETVSFSLVADGGQEYNATLYILKVKDEKSNQSGRAHIYQFEMIGREYFGDRANLVQQAFKGIVGTDAIQKIHSQFIGGPLSVIIPSAGLLFQKNSHVISSSKPFKAIDDLRRMLVYPGVSTGSSVYFRDKDNVKLAPVEYLFNTMSPTQTFVQRATWGTSWTDIWNSHNAIISAETTIEGQGSRASYLEMSAAAAQEYKVIDVFSNKVVFNTLAQSAGILGAIAGGSHGGKHNYLTIDSQKIPKENTRRTDKENLLRAKITNQLVLKVPIQGGLNCTVGKGIYAQLLPPMGELEDTYYQPKNGGLMLVADLMHEFNNNDKQIAGTTTMRTVRLEK